VWTLWQANIFYPYPNTLAFSEHLFSSALILLPFTLLGDTPLVAANLGVLFTTALSGWAMYLLVTWLSGNRWAGLIAGLFFAISPFRMGHIIQLHLLSTQWIPLAFLALARLIKLNRTTDLVLLLIFTNLQFFASVNYAPLVALALGGWGLFYLLAYRRIISAALLGRLVVFAMITAALNWPVLRLYQQVSDHMGIIRSLGDARVYGASLAHYTTPLANSLLYVRWLGLSGLLDSAFPGLVALVLAAAGVILVTKQPQRLAVWALLLISLLGFTLSFGANELAFGERLAPLATRLLPYPYLYQAIPLLQGLRAPIRFALLVTFGLAILAGLGFSELARQRWAAGRRAVIAAILSAGLILLEHLPAPLPGQAVAYGGPLYTRLAGLPAQAIVLELPYYLHTQASYLELQRVYHSAGHWRRLANGASGFRPAWLVKLGPFLDVFPDWRSLELARQLGVNYLVLHHDQYETAAWDNLTALLPGYLPALESIESVGDDLILQLRPPTCSADINQMQVDATAFPNLTFTNTGPAAYVADPRRPSFWSVDGQSGEFLEPLLIMPGQTLSMTLPAAGSHWRVELAHQKRLLAPEAARVGQPTTLPAGTWQPVQISFANGAVLQAVVLSEEIARPCGSLNLGLQWSWPENSDSQVRVELLDRFGRMVVDSTAQALSGPEPTVSSHLLPLAETVPPGQYQLRVRLLAEAGTEIAALGPEGAPMAQPIALPVIIRPAPGPAQPGPLGEVAQLANGASLVGLELARTEFQPGDWVRFTLTWQTQETISGDFTVFTQLLGPDGRVWGQYDNPPSGGWYPTSLWQPGELVRDDYAVRLDPTASPGEYRLVMGMYDSGTSQRVPVTAGSNQGNDFIEAGKITVVAP
jgi:hypothetical protein